MIALERLVQTGICLYLLAIEPLISLLVPVLLLVERLYLRSLAVLIQELFAWRRTAFPLMLLHC